MTVILVIVGDDDKEGGNKNKDKGPKIGNEIALKRQKKTKSDM